MSKKTATKKRTDNKGRNLNTGEYQSKDGSYEYKYKDKYGKSQSIYSWMLFDTDEPPAGKQCVKSLRAMEEEITKDRIHNLDISRKAQRKTLNQAWDDYLATAINLKDSTRENYTYMWNHFVRESFGAKKVKDITYTDVKKFYIYI